MREEFGPARFGARPHAGSVPDMRNGFETWTAAVPNLAEHADNPVHTDDGGRAAGYAGAIVAGTTVYALMSHVVASAWGLDWVSGGGCEIRFRSPVLADEVIDFVPGQTEDGWMVAAGGAEDTRATCAAWLDAAAPELRDGEPLEVLSGPLEPWGTYGARCGDDLELYSAGRIAHPAAWPCIANRLFSDQLIDGPWVHVRSRIAHLGAAPLAAQVTTDARVVDRFDTRAGRRAVVDCLIRADGEPVAFVEHEAIVELF
jgi:hypothetical protein